uniref:Beta/gamma crystallin 'Greek key' domain-containing protein n=1 Tax=Leptobrachium leishanense TaxID=445787 RepID=A0A8C5M7I0_9ANUR
MTLDSEVNMWNRRPKSCIVESHCESPTLKNARRTKNTEIAKSFDCLSGDVSSSYSGAEFAKMECATVQSSLTLSERYGEEEEPLPKWAENILKEYLSPRQINITSPLYPQVLGVLEEDEEPLVFQSPLYYHRSTRDNLQFEISQNQDKTHAAQDDYSTCEEVQALNFQYGRKVESSVIGQGGIKSQSNKKHKSRYTIILTQDKIQNEPCLIPFNIQDTSLEAIQDKTLKNQKLTHVVNNETIHNQKTLHTNHSQEMVNQGTTEIKNTNCQLDHLTDEEQKINIPFYSNMLGQDMTGAHAASPKIYNDHSKDHKLPIPPKIRYQVIITMTKEEQKEGAEVPEKGVNILRNYELAGPDLKLSPSSESQACVYRGADPAEVTDQEHLGSQTQAEKDTEQEEEITQKRKGGEDFEGAHLDRSLNLTPDEECSLPPSGCEQKVKLSKPHFSKMEKESNLQRDRRCSPCRNPHPRTVEIRTTYETSKVHIDRERDSVSEQARKLSQSSILPQHFAGHVKGLRKVFEDVSVTEKGSHHKNEGNVKLYGSLRVKKRTVTRDIPISPGVHEPVHAQRFNPNGTFSWKKKVERGIISNKSSSSVQHTVPKPRSCWDSKDRPKESAHETYTDVAEIVSLSSNNIEVDPLYKDNKPLPRALRLPPQIPATHPENIKNNASVSHISPKGWSNETHLVRSAKAILGQTIGKHLRTLPPNPPQNSDKFAFCSVKAELFNVTSDSSESEDVNIENVIQSLRSKSYDSDISKLEEEQLKSSVKQDRVRNEHNLFYLDEAKCRLESEIDSDYVIADSQDVNSGQDEDQRSKATDVRIKEKPLSEAKNQAKNAWPDKEDPGQGNHKSDKYQSNNYTTVQSMHKNNNDIQALNANRRQKVVTVEDKKDRSLPVIRGNKEYDESLVEHEKTLALTTNRQRNTYSKQVVPLKNTVPYVKLERKQDSLTESNKENTITIRRREGVLDDRRKNNTVLKTRSNSRVEELLTDNTIQRDSSSLSSAAVHPVGFPSEEKNENQRITEGNLEKISIKKPFDETTPLQISTANISNKGEQDKNTPTHNDSRFIYKGTRARLSMEEEKMPKLPKIQINNFPNYHVDSPSNRERAADQGRSVTDKPEDAIGGEVINQCRKRIRQDEHVTTRNRDVVNRTNDVTESVQRERKMCLDQTENAIRKSTKLIDRARKTRYVSPTEEYRQQSNEDTENEHSSGNMREAKGSRSKILQHTAVHVSKIEHTEKGNYELSGDTDDLFQDSVILKNVEMNDEQASDETLFFTPLEKSEEEQAGSTCDVRRSLSSRRKNTLYASRETTRWKSKDLLDQEKQMTFPTSTVPIKNNRQQLGEDEQSGDSIPSVLLENMKEFADHLNDMHTKSTPVQISSNKNIERRVYDVADETKELSQGTTIFKDKNIVMEDVDEKLYLSTRETSEEEPEERTSIQEDIIAQTDYEDKYDKTIKYDDVFYTTNTNEEPSEEIYIQPRALDNSTHVPDTSATTIYISTMLEKSDINAYIEIITDKTGNIADNSVNIGQPSSTLEIIPQMEEEETGNAIILPPEDEINHTVEELSREASIQTAPKVVDNIKYIINIPEDMVLNAPIAVSVGDVSITPTKNETENPVNHRNTSDDGIIITSTMDDESAMMDEETVENDTIYLAVTKYEQAKSDHLENGIFFNRNNMLDIQSIQKELIEDGGIHSVLDKLDPGAYHTATNNIEKTQDSIIMDDSVININPIEDGIHIAPKEDGPASLLFVYPKEEKIDKDTNHPGNLIKHFENRIENEVDVAIQPYFVKVDKPRENSLDSPTKLTTEWREQSNGIFQISGEVIGIVSIVDKTVTTEVGDKPETNGNIQTYLDNVYQEEQSENGDFCAWIPSNAGENLSNILTRNYDDHIDGVSYMNSTLNTETQMRKEELTITTPVEADVIVLAQKRTTKDASEPDPSVYVQDMQNDDYIQSDIIKTSDNITVIDSPHDIFTVTAEEELGRHATDCPNEGKLDQFINAAIGSYENINQFGDDTIQGEIARDLKLPLDKAEYSTYHTTILDNAYNQTATDANIITNIDASINALNKDTIQTASNEELPANNQIIYPVEDDIIHTTNLNNDASIENVFINQSSTDYNTIEVIGNEVVQTTQFTGGSDNVMNIVSKEEVMNQNDNKIQTGIAHEASDMTTDRPINLELPETVEEQQDRVTLNIISTQNNDNSSLKNISSLDSSRGKEKESVDYDVLVSNTRYSTISGDKDLHFMDALQLSTKINTCISDSLGWQVRAGALTTNVMSSDHTSYQTPSKRLYEDISEFKAVMPSVEEQKLGENFMHESQLLSPEKGKAECVVSEQSVYHSEVDEDTNVSENMMLFVNRLQQLDTPELMKRPRTRRKNPASTLSMVSALPTIKEDQIMTLDNGHCNVMGQLQQENKETEKSSLLIPDSNHSELEIKDKIEETAKKYSWERNPEVPSSKASPLEMMRKHSGDEDSRSATYKALITQNLSQRQGSIIGSLLLTSRLDKTPEKSEGKFYSRLDSSILLSSYIKSKNNSEGTEEEAQPASQDELNPTKNKPFEPDRNPSCALECPPSGTIMTSTGQPQDTDMTSTRQIQDNSMNGTGQSQDTAMTSNRQPQNIDIISTGQPQDIAIISTGQPQDIAIISTGKPQDIAIISTGKPQDITIISTGQPQDIAMTSSGQPQNIVLTSSRQPLDISMTSTSQPLDTGIASISQLDAVASFPVSGGIPHEPYTSITSQLKDLPDIWHHTEKPRGKLNPRPGKIILFSEPGFKGKKHDIYSDMGNTSSLEIKEFISVRVIRGGWLIYEKPLFRGRRLMLLEGDTDLTCPWKRRIKTDSEEGTNGRNSWIGSLRHVVKDFQIPQVSLFPEENGNGEKLKIVGPAPDTRVNGQPIKTESVIIHSGLWLLYSKPFFEGDPYILESGGYPNRKSWGGLDTHLCSLQPARIGGPAVEKPNEPRLHIFQYPAFEGEMWEVTRDLHSVQGELLTTVGSMKVLGGCWVGYEKEGFRGHQYLLEEGEFRNWPNWGGRTEELGSLRLIRTDFSEPEIVLYEDPGCSEGPCLRLSEALSDLEVAQYRTKTGSIHVLSGVWVAYENVDFSGEQYILEKGTYHNYQDWGAENSTICSLQPVLQIQLFSEPNFHGNCLICGGNRVLLPETFSPESCRVEGGCWILYEGDNCTGEQYVLPEGEYPTHTAMGCMTVCVLRSLRKVPFYFSIPSISLHGLERFEGKELEFSGEVRSLQGEGYNNHVLSVRVESGIWVLYEHSDFRGRQWLLERKEIPNWLLYSGLQRIGSLCPIRQRRVYFRLRNRALKLFLTVPEHAEDMKASRVLVTEPKEGNCELWYYEEGHIKNQIAPHMSLQVVGKSDPGTKVVLWAEGRKPIQIWSIQDSGYIISHTLNGMCLDIKGGDDYDSDHVVVWNVDEDRHTQRWDIDVY